MDRVKTLRWLNYALTGLIASHRRVRQDAKHNVAPLGLIKLIPPTRYDIYCAANLLKKYIMTMRLKLFFQ